MSDVKWIKITTNVFDDEKIRYIESMPESDTIIVIWFKLLVLAGKCNSEGFVMLTDKIPYKQKMLASYLNRKETVIQLALEVFQQLGMIEITDEEAILISNWSKHQNLAGLDKIKEQNKIRQQKFRDTQKQLEHDASKEKKESIKEKKETYNKDLYNKELDIEGHVTNNVMRNVTKCDKKKDLIADRSLEFQNTFNDFVEMRKKMKSPMTDKAVKLLLSNVDKLSDDAETQIAILNQSIMNGWKSVYALKVEMQKGKNGKPLPPDVEVEWLDGYIKKFKEDNK